MKDGNSDIAPARACRPGYRAFFMRLLLPAVLALCFGFGLLAALHLPGNHFIRASLAIPMLWLIPLGLLLVLDRKKDGRSRTDCVINLPIIALFAGLVVFLYSSASLHRNFFFLKWACAEGSSAAACFFSGASILVFVAAANGKCSLTKSSCNTNISRWKKR